MSTFADSPPIDRNAPVEWPTVALLGVVHGGFLALTWFHAALPLGLWLPLAAWISAWWGSVQHELLHGHPTRSRRLNTLLATPPWWLWLPYDRYRQTHLAHHCDERLTDPLDDPESRYLTPEVWATLGPVARAIVHSQSVLAGRLAFGPFIAVVRFCGAEWERARAGCATTRRIWAMHAVHVALVLVWAIAICGMPVWQYLLGFVYFGTALALIRSFAEHRAHEEAEKRTAIVERAPVLGLLFLNNNLHVAHHKWPTVPWYRLPALYRAERARLIAENGGLVYRGYGDIFRRFFFRPHDAPVHPQGRAVRPGRGTQPEARERERAEA
jgi:fatty acid desaturase